MQITSNTTGAATFAMQKAMAMPEIVLDLVRHAAAAAGEPLATPPPAGPFAVLPATVSGKGRMIEVVV